MAKNNKPDVLKLTRIALLMAVEIVLSRFVSIATPVTKIGVAFIPLSMIGMLYGPLYGGIAGALCDFIGAILFPIGAYFPGYTLTAALSGATYGLFLQNGGAKSWTKITVCSLIINLIYQLGINTYWTTLFTGKGYLALLPTRMFSNVVLAPFEIIVIYYTYKIMVSRVIKQDI